MTAADIRQQIEQLHTDRAALQARQDEITTIMARNWHNRDESLETEFNTNSARLEAAGKALAQLERDLEQATTDDMLTQHGALYAEAMTLKAEYDKLATKRDKLAEKLKLAQEEAAAANQVYNRASSQLRQIEHDLERRGISRAALYAQLEQSA